MTIIPIAPYTMGSPAQPKVGIFFEVRYVNYTSPTAVADCRLLDAEGVEIMPEAATSPRSVIEAQVTNGVAVRMALLYRLSGEPAPTT